MMIYSFVEHRSLSSVIKFIEHTSLHNFPKKIQKLLYILIKLSLFYTDTKLDSNMQKDNRNKDNKNSITIIQFS
jgi:hypothetical protein